jgi:thiol-disulfide isomerase/thioredoxin
MAFGAAGLGVFGAAKATQRGSAGMPAIYRATEWINSAPLTPSSLAGKIVLVDFWTYTCINWLRTLPYVRAWAGKYKERLVVIGVHTPEFPFEHDVENVRRAVRQLHIDYPVVVDNGYGIWRAFDNHYWPALYFVDPQGRVRHHHFGEGEYESSEKFIQRLAAEAGGGDSHADVVSVVGQGIEASADWETLRSPETYVGSDRAESFASGVSTVANGRRVYAVPARLALNQWALAGEWSIGRQAAVLSSHGGRIVHRFHARDLHLVMSPPRSGMPVRFSVSIDGQPPGPAHGADVDERGNGTVVEPRLYQLIRQPKPIVDRQFAIEFLDTGVETFAFTFG